VKILLSAYTGLGNFVLKTPMIKLLREQYPQASIDLIAGNGFGAELVLGNSQLINHIHRLKIDASAWQRLCFFAALRQQQYDYLLLPFDADHRFLRIGAIIAHIKHTIRHTRLDWAALEKTPQPTTIVYPKWTQLRQTKVPLLPNRHEIDLNLDLLQCLNQIEQGKKNDKTTICATENGNITPSTTPTTFVQYEPNEAILTHYGIAPQQYIVLQAGAANGLYKAKVWSPDNFIALIPRLLQQYQQPILLVGDDGDKRVFIAPIAAAFAHEPRVINTAGETNFAQLLTLLANARVVICHDSGVMHLADALNVPLLALYGPTDHARTHPRRNTSHTLIAHTPYKGIMHYFATHEAALEKQGIGHQAMQSISPDMIMETLHQMHI
jgi:ADP-heptose:LPS heptosyltransferase